MTAKSQKRTHPIHALLPARSALAAAVLACVSWSAAAQTVVNLTPGQEIWVQDPLGGGRVAGFAFLTGSETTVFSSGDYAQSGSLFDIGGALGAINVAKLQITGIDGTSISEQFVLDEVGETARTGVTASAGITSLDIWADGADAGKINTLNVAGTLAMSGTRISGTLTGGSLQISQLRVGLASGQVVANLTGTRAAVGTKPAVAFNAPNTVLWTFDPVADVEGPKQIKPASLMAADPVAAVQADGFTNVVAVGTNAQGYTQFQFSPYTNINNLSMTSAGSQFLIDALGLLATGQDALNAVNNSQGKWGSINTALTFETAIPEPSTYALMGLGLVGIALAARRNTPSV